MKQYKTKERVEIESGSRAERLEIYLNNLDPVFPSKVEDLPIKLEDLRYKTDESVPWNVQCIRFEHNPEREMLYRNTKLRWNDCQRRISLLLRSISKEAFARVLRRYRHDFRYRKFDGTYRKERVLIPVPTVSKLVEVEKELKPSDFYLELARVCKDESKRKQYYGLRKYYLDNPDLDRNSDKRRFLYRGSVVELSIANGTAQLMNNMNVAAYRLTPNYQVGIRRSYDWSAIRRWWHSQVERVQSQIGIQLRLRDYYHRYLNDLSASSRLESNRASQISQVGQITPTTFSERWECYRNPSGSQPYLWDRSTIYLPNMPVTVPLVSRIAEMTTSTEAFPTLEICTCMVSDIPEFEEIPEKSDHFRDYVELLRSRANFRTGTVTLDGSDAWKLAFPDVSDESELRHRLILASGDHGYVQIKTNRQWVNGIQDPYVYTSYTVQTSIVRVDVGPDTYDSDERLLRTIRQSLPIRSLMLGEEASSALRENIEVAHARLRALDISEHDKDHAFNLARSVAELKDLPQTCRTLGQLSKFIKEMTSKQVWIAESRGRSSDAVRLCLANSGDSWSRTLRQAARHSDNLGYRRVTRRPLALLGYKHLCAAYLCWKFGVSQTLADAETLARKGITWCTTVQRGLRLLASKLDQKQLVHNISVGWSKPLDDGMPHEKRGKRAKNGTRPFFPQSYVRDVINSPATVRTLELTWNDGLLAYVTGQTHENVRRLPSGTVVVFDSTGFGFPMVPYGAYRKVDNQALRTLTEAAMHRIADRLAIRQRVFTSQSIRGKVYGRYSIAKLLKTVRKGGLIAKIMGFHPAEVVWELAPVSFVAEWFSNLRSLVVAADRMLYRAVQAPAQPIGKPWVVAATRLWAGCPEISGSLHVKEEFSQPIAKLTTSTIVAEVQESSQQSIRKQQRVDTVEYYYSQRTLRFTYSEPVRYSVNMVKTGIRRFIRCPLSGSGSLPPFKLRCNLNLGKLTSLLAMLTGRQ